MDGGVFSVCSEVAELSMIKLTIIYDDYLQEA
jgi:hypothetical protein